jgi:hypothetical protein
MRASALSAIAALFFLTLCATGISMAESAAVSRFPVTPGGDVGRFDISWGLTGEIERTIQFEVVPGEDFTFDMRLWNPHAVEKTSHVEVIILLPNDGRMTYYDEMVTLEAGGRFRTVFNQPVPPDLQVFGRFTAQLLIDDRMVDFFQFDMNERGSIVVRWDDGLMANAWAFYNQCDAWAIRGCFPAGTVLDSAGVYILSEGDAFWPWPDDIHQDILIEVFDNDGAGELPGTLLFSDVTRVTPGTSEAVVFPGIPVSSAFYIANKQLTNFPACEGQAVDDGVDHPDQMFTLIDNAWGNAGGQYAGDFMMWAVGHVGSQRVSIGAPPLE